MKKRLSHFAYNERSRSSWTLTIPHFTPLSPIRSTIKTVTYVPGTFVTLVSGPHKGGSRGILSAMKLTTGKISPTPYFPKRGNLDYSGERRLSCFKLTE